mgnify:CR=1 FL=1
MTSITQDMKYRLSLIKYAEKYGVTKAAIRYKTNRQYIYRWKRRYDGTIESLRCHSSRPHHHPNQHTPEEIKLIRDVIRRNPHAGLVILWVKLMQRGYKRSITGLYRFLRKQGILAVKPPNPKYIPKPYEKMDYPGQRIQIDVKFVPAVCLVNEAKGQKFYQYTAIDEYSRWRFVEAFEEHSSYSSAQFLEHLVKAFPYPIECVQTDNGQEFTKRFGTGVGSDKPTLFQAHLALDAVFFINRRIPKALFIFYHRNTVFGTALLAAFTSHTFLFYPRYVLHFIPLNFFSDTPSPLLYVLSTAHQLSRNQSPFH